MLCMNDTASPTAQPWIHSTPRHTNPPSIVRTARAVLVTDGHPAAVCQLHTRLMRGAVACTTAFPRNGCSGLGLACALCSRRYARMHEALRAIISRGRPAPALREPMLCGSGLA